MKKFIVAVVAALALSLCVLPMSVFADDGGDAGVFAMNSTEVGGMNVSSYPFEYIDIAAIPNQVYTGKKIQPLPKVMRGSGSYALPLEKDVDYKVSYVNNTNVGTATARFEGINGYVGMQDIEFKIVPASNSITKYMSKKTLKYKTLKKKTLTFKIAAVDKFKAKKTYKLTKVPKKAKKYIKVSKAGKVTVKKGIKKGTYKIKVRITAPATKNYKALKVTKQITIKVK